MAKPPPPGSNRNAWGSGAEALLQTAERLYAEHGIQDISLREISRAASQRNLSAAQYHFKNRKRLVAAIFERRMTIVDTKRLECLRTLERSGQLRDLRSLIWAFVTPLVEFSRSPASKGYYVRFLAAALMMRDEDFSEFATNAPNLGFHWIYSMLAECLAWLPEPIFRQRYMILFSQTIQGLAEIENLIERRKRQGRSFDPIRAVENLIDMLTGAIGAQVSPATMQTLEASAKKPRRRRE